jgi:RIO kinase 1
MKKSLEKFKIYKNVFDNFTLRTLFKLSTEGHFHDLISPVMIGKEANVFLASTEDNEMVIVKVYRLHSCNFNKMHSYIISDPRYQQIKNQRRQVIFKWVQREYRNLILAREKLNVPQPIAFLNNVLVMESIGDNMPAPQLKDSLPKNIKIFSEKIIDSVFKLSQIGLIHGDLSEFNILNYKEEPYFIDFSQSTTIKDPNALEYLERDLKNLYRFFKKNNHLIDYETVFQKIKKEIIK